MKYSSQKLRQSSWGIDSSGLGWDRATLKYLEKAIKHLFVQALLKQAGLIPAYMNTPEFKGFRGKKQKD